MLKIEIKSEELNIKSGTSNGRPYEIREQEGYWHQDGKPYPVGIKINLGQNDAPYKAGFYKVLPDSFYVGKYGELRVGKLQLESVRAQAVA